MESNRSREKIFRYTLILLPIAFFALLELILRLTDYGGDQNLFRELVLNGKPFYAVNPDVTRRYFRTIQVRATLSNDVFEKEKGAHTWRVFCLGASSTLGYPYYFNGTFPSMLKDRLETLWPDKNIEVINLGITAVTSYTVLDLMKELPPYGPDAVLVYCGHNEFYGALGAGSSESLGQSRWAVKLYLALQEWRAFRLVRDGLLKLRQVIGPPGDASREVTAMEGMVRNREINVGSVAYNAARDAFRANLEETVAFASQNKIPIVVGTLVSNLSGMEPFVSVFADTSDQQRRREWERHYEAGQHSLLDGRYGDAVQSLDSAVALDATPAKAHFALARACEATGRLDRARVEYTLARDLDALRFRAPTEFNAIIREITPMNGGAVAECEHLIEGESDHGIVGKKFLLEHVHLKIDGYFLIAKAFATALAEQGILAPKVEWEGKAALSDSEYRSRIRITPLDSVAAAIRLYVLTNSWPFKEAGISVHQFPASSALERLAKSYLQKDITWEQAHVQMAEQYEKEGNLVGAIGEYRALAKATPQNPSPHLRMGRAMLDLGNLSEAEREFSKALSLEESFHAHHGLGVIYMRSEKFREAGNEVRAALQFSGTRDRRDAIQTQYFLAAALAAEGEYAEALRNADAIVAAYPDFQPARELSQRLQETLRNKAGRAR